MPSSLNSTFISLIPKKPNADSVKNFRPISLYNMIYKLVSKVITNRLKPLMTDIISSNHNAFIPSRLITDNIMVTYELLHTLKRRKKGRVGHMAVKLDMSKAYDRVEWHYLQEAMRALGLNEKWIELIMS